MAIFRKIAGKSAKKFLKYVWLFESVLDLATKWDQKNLEICDMTLTLS